MHPQLLQFLGSLAAILVLAGIVWGLKLGPERKLDSEDEARRAADEAVDGFDATHLSVDREGRGALMSDASGNVLLLRPHGTHFAGRILTPEASATIEGDTLIIDTAEKRYGAARLVLDDAPAWVQRIEGIK